VSGWRRHDDVIGPKVHAMLLPCNAKATAVSALCSCALTVATCCGWNWPQM
jgi:hypothetical protein